MQTSGHSPAGDNGHSGEQYSKNEQPVQLEQRIWTAPNWSWVCGRKRNLWKYECDNRITPRDTPSSFSLSKAKY